MTCTRTGDADDAVSTWSDGFLIFKCILLLFRDYKPLVFFTTLALLLGLALGVGVLIGMFAGTFKLMRAKSEAAECRRQARIADQEVRALHGVVSALACRPHDPKGK